MKKVYIVALGIWAGLIIYILIARLFNVTGLYIGLFSFLGLGIILGLYDLTVSLMIGRSFNEGGSGIDMDKNLKRLIRLNGWPLTKGEQVHILLGLQLIYQNQGKLDKADAIIFKLPLKSLKGKVCYSALLLRKDYALEKEDRDMYALLDKEQKETYPAYKEEQTKESLAARFYFGLLDGVIDSDIEKDALAYLEESSSSKMDELFFSYVASLVKSLRKEKDLTLKESLLKAQGTWLEPKFQKLVSETGKDM